MGSIRVIVLTGYGLNCDIETSFAFEKAGGIPDRVHINALIERPAMLDDYQIMVLGGGFSWGDDHGAGVIESVRLKTRIKNEILAFVEKKRLVLGICNGFQTLANLGLLPGFDRNYDTRSVALTYNDCGNFRDQWVNLAIDTRSPCVFTRGIKQIELPVRHGEGKFYTDDDTLSRLEKNRQVVMRYSKPAGSLADGVFPFNPNGSLNDIAGICDASGRIFGLMPHPEAFNHPSNHPDWPGQKDMDRRQRNGKNLSSQKAHMQTGILLFENAVSYF